MKKTICMGGLALFFAGSQLSFAQVSQEALQSISTPDKVDTRIGTLEFRDGAPSADTAQAAYDHLDFTYAFRAFTDTFKGVSMQAILEGLQSVGIKENEVILFSELMDSDSLFLTANADTVYYFTFVDLSDGPMVVETPPDALGTFDDMWFRWVIDFGRPGPDRGEGGKYLLVGPDYDGYLPEDGFYVAHSRTNRVAMLGRSFLTNDDPAPTVKAKRPGPLSCRDRMLVGIGGSACGEAGAAAALRASRHPPHPQGLPACLPVAPDRQAWL